MTHGIKFEPTEVHKDIVWIMVLSMSWIRMDRIKRILLWSIQINLQIKLAYRFTLRICSKIQPSKILPIPTLIGFANSTIQFYPQNFLIINLSIVSFDRVSMRKFLGRSWMVEFGCSRVEYRFFTWPICDGLPNPYQTQPDLANLRIFFRELKR